VKILKHREASLSPTLLVAFLALTFFFAPAHLLIRQKSDEGVVKLHTRLVNLNVSVTDRRSKSVSQLRREDFLVSENGVQQTVVHFEPINAPVNLVLLMDLSGSLGGKLDSLKRAAKKFIDSLKDNDRIAVGVFASRFNLVSGFTSDRKLLKKRIERLESTEGDTALYDAVWAAFDLLGEIKEARKALVVLTDGVDSSFRPDEQGSKHAFEELLMRAVEEDATVYPIYFDTEAETGGHYSPEAFSTARKQLQALADDTGGTRFNAARAKDLDGVYQQVSAELHSLYSVAYAANDTRKDGRWRRINVKVNREGMVAKTKRGYYAK
jgi:Ca-activated chloride channel family protein